MKSNIRVSPSGYPRRNSTGTGAESNRPQGLLESDADSPVSTTTVRRRWVLAGAAALIVITGLVVHFAIDGPAGDFVADALYAVMIFLAVSFVFVRAPTWRIAALSYAICVGIELFQLTGIPAALAADIPVVWLLLGTTFSPVDLLAYLVGVLGVAIVSTTRRLD